MMTAGRYLCERELHVSATYYWDHSCRAMIGPREVAMMAQRPNGQRKLKPERAARKTTEYENIVGGRGSFCVADPETCPRMLFGDSTTRSLPSVAYFEEAMPRFISHRKLALPTPTELANRAQPSIL
jgi:hypothetical protein